MKSYEVILFDLDGTITDSSEGITNSVKYMLKQYGIEEKREKSSCRNIKAGSICKKNNGLFSSYTIF